MSTRPDCGAALRCRLLGPGDRRAVARIADMAFSDIAFYQTALGFTAEQFGRFWDVFFDLALTDARCDVLGLERGGELVAAVVIGYDGFPSRGNGLRFLTRLVRPLGLRAWLRYLAFVAAYEKAMRRPASERRVEACGLWLFVTPQAAHGGLGGRLVREVTEFLRRKGKALITGFVDAGNRPLLAFYSRHGYRVLPAFAFRGQSAARIERWVEPVAGAAA